MPQEPTTPLEPAPLDDTLTGRTYASAHPYTVGREKIREFADAIGDPNPVYRDPEAAKAHGHPDVIAPPTFPIVVAFDLLQRMLADLALPLHQIMHADQKFVAARAIHPGDRLWGTLAIDRVRRMAGNDLIFTRTDIVSDTGEPVCTAHATIVRQGAPAGATSAGGAPAGDGPRGEEL